MKKRIVIVAGGSGGHITPALAVASELSAKDVFFLCSRNHLDQEILSAAGVEFRAIFAGKLRRYFSWENFLDFFRFWLGFFESFFLFIFRRPQVIFSKGGFVALPVGLAAWILRIPLVLHESDAEMGLANRVLSFFAKKILSSFHLPKSQFVGTPVRPLILAGDQKRGKEFLDFSDNKPILLIMGGSQGALFINNLVRKSLADLTKIANIVVIAGAEKTNFPLLESLRVYGFLNQELGDVLAAADLVVSRAGSNSLAELAALKKPTILIPLPSAANNHQQKNAETFAAKGATIILAQEKVVPADFIVTVHGLLKDEKQRKMLAKNIGSFFFPSSAQKIAAEIRKFLI